MKNKIIHFPTFNTEQMIPHGGTKRSKQIREIITEAGGESLYIIKDLKLSNIDFSIFKVILVSPYLIFKTLFIVSRLYFKYISFKGAVTLFYQFMYMFTILDFNDLKKTDIFCEIGANQSMFFPYFFKTLGLNVHIIPHNIEFMIPYSKNKYFKSQMHLCKYELSVYKDCLCVFCISNFDKAILDCYSIKTSILSYYPTIEDVNFFIDIKDKRQSSSKEYSVLFGSANNPPTRLGMERFILNFIENNRRDKLVIAGLGTEVFKKYENDIVKVFGTITNDELRDILVKANSIIINPLQTTGFLTKIVEFNIAEIPMFIFGKSYIQGQNLTEYGVYCVDSIEDFYKILNESLEVKNKFEKVSLFN